MLRDGHITHREALHMPPRSEGERVWLGRAEPTEIGTRFQGVAQISSVRVPLFTQSGPASIEHACRPCRSGSLDTHVRWSGPSSSSSESKEGGMSLSVVGHRGASAAEPPGNTIAAFRRAAELGADWVELDARRTADDAVVVHHDAELPDGRVIRSVPAAELTDWVPTLEAALDACDGMKVNVEIKNSPDDPDFDESRSIADAVVD